MANYNPHTPDIVGQEWVPIIGQPYQPDITEERGYSFTVSRSTLFVPPVVARRGLFVLDSVPSGVTTSQVPFMSVYRKGNERTGPIMKSVIECADAVSSGSNGAFFGALTGSQALRNPSDGSGYNFITGTAPVSGILDLAFSSTDLPALAGRIYNVSLLYSASGDGLAQATAPNSMLVSLRYRSTDFYYSTGALETGPSFRGDLSKISRISLGEINPNWSNATFTATNDRYPWTLSRLQLFDDTSVDPMRIRFSWFAPELNTDLRLYYAALEITYSPFENRLMYGGTHMGIDQCATGTSPNYGFGGDDTRNRVMLRTANSFATGAALELPTGEYTVTFNLADYGDANQPIFNINAAAATNTRPTLAAVRELYEVPSINGIEIERAFDVADTITVAESRIIPAIGIAATGTQGAFAGADVYAGCHGYYSPQVGDAILIAVPSQGFRSDNKDGPLPYPWIRFYARQTSGPVRSDAYLTFDMATGPGTVRISSAELDALPEIFDGWREVTLRFADGDVPTLDGDASTLRTITWTADNVAITNGIAYQVLGAISSLMFENAKYQGRIATNSEAVFPLSSITGDYTFLFSTDPPPITGVGVSTGSVALTGIGTECGITPECIPTSVSYNRVTWPAPRNQTVIFDSFDRTVVNSWGTSSSGQVWTTSGGSAADYDVDATTSRGTHNHTANGTPHNTLIGPSTTRDFEITVDFIAPAVSPAAQPMQMSAIGRWTNSSTFYEYRLEWNTGIIRDTTLGVHTGTGLLVVDAMIPFINIGPNDRIRMRAFAQGTTLGAKVWNITNGDTEPELWQVVGSDSTLTQGQVGVRSNVVSGSTATLPITFGFDTFNVTPTTWNFGYYELQRSDDDTPWQTIMRATSSTVTGFSDFEARIGMESDYRIRQVNVYDFPGLWSTTVSNTLPSPVTGTGADGHTLLIFTSNANQTHGQTLAYEEVWDGNPTEEMTYFEGEGMLQFQRLYGRDYQVGFHALERGGVQFERTMLVQNAAVPPPILENAFESLRDMAWDALPYVCVRTNLGDRWYAAVEVPSGAISRARRLQLMQVKITEVGDEPYPVDPPGAPRAV